MLVIMDVSTGVKVVAKNSGSELLLPPAKLTKGGAGPSPVEGTKNKTKQNKTNKQKKKKKPSQKRRNRKMLLNICTT
jgi:hypothetical protein